MMKPQPVAKSTLLVSFCLFASSLAVAADAPSNSMMMSSKKPTADAALQKVVADPGRTAKYVARDPFRHPAEELAFFGIKPNMTVVEVWPGGGYWTEILGPYLKDSGRYYAAVTVRGESKEEDATTAKWRTNVEQQKARYGNVT